MPTASWPKAPPLGQWRGQIGHCLNAQNEIGVWGTLRDRSADEVQRRQPDCYRPLSQVNLFWHHTLLLGSQLLVVVRHARTVITPRSGQRTAGRGPWGGAVVTSAGNDGSLGEFTLEATFIVPISQVLGPVRQRLLHAAHGLGGGYAASVDSEPTRSASAWRSIPAATPAPPRWPATAGCPICRWPTTAPSSWTATSATSSFPRTVSQRSAWPFPPGKGHATARTLEPTLGRPSPAPRGSERPAAFLSNRLHEP